MVEILARCGYRCDLCPAYIANIHHDNDRQQISDGWFKYFGFRIPPEKINCTGCVTNSEPLDTECPVRPCVNQKGLENCGYCRAIPCDKLKTRMDFLDQHPVDISMLPADDYNRFFQPYLSKDRLMKIQSTIDKRKKRRGTK